MTVTDPDPAVAELEAIRGRFRFADDEVGLKVVRDIYGTDPTRRSPAGHIAASALDVPRLLAVAEAALKHHQPEASWSWPPELRCERHVAPNRPEIAELERCPDCKPKAGQRFCVTCRVVGGSAWWPCPEYRDITGALAGKEQADVT